jgi:hypothetical protein
VGAASRTLARLLLAIFLLAGNARSSTITKLVRFDSPRVARTAAGVSLEIAGCRSIGMQGEPILPVYAARFVIPPNETTVNVSVDPERIVTLEGSYDPAPMPPQSPLGTAPLAWSRNEAVYRSVSPVPAARGALITEQVLAGVRIAFVNVYPCQVIPASGTVLFAPGVRITVETAPVSGPIEPQPPAQTQRALAAVARFVENPEAAAAYRRASPAPTTLETPEELAHYVIITAPEFVSSFEPLAELKTRMGLRARIIDTAWILANFAGIDAQDKIRNFIKYAYANWETRYVLLGGDDEIIPHRGFYVKFGTTVDVNIPSDLYYACLDGRWNNDGDAYYGEPGEEDLLPEVSVGRLPVDSAEEIANVVQKISAYTLSPIESQCASALSLGELLWSTGGVDTYGGDYKDEVRFGSSNFGMTTAGIPPLFAQTTLYDRDLGSWGPAQLLPILNAGVNLVNHLGHASLYDVLRLSPGDVPSLTNDGVNASYFVCYSQGCYAASFDNRDDVGVVHPEDCIGEELVMGPHGAVAFIGNTRLGWDAPYTTCGVSQFFDRQFFDAIFGEGITTIGDALTDSRIDNIPAIPYDGVRWVYYELCLLGDPALPLWTAAPRPLTVSHDPVLYTGQGGFEIHVADADGPVSGAFVCLNGDTPNVYCAASTDGAGSALLEPNVDEDGVLVLSIVSPNHYPYTDTIPVADSAVYLASIDSVSVHDDKIGTSLGNDNGVAEPGETIDLRFTVVNRGQETLRNTVVTIATSDAVLRIVDSVYVAGDIGPGGSILVDTAFAIHIQPGAEDGHRALFEFSVRADEGQWRIPGSIAICAGNVALESWSMSDAPHGNGNGCIDAWEFVNLLATWRNRGTTDILAPTVVLSFPPGSWGKGIKWQVRAPVLAAGASLGFPGELLWFVGEFTPPFTPITMFLTFTGKNIPAHVDTLLVHTCGYGLDAAADTEEPLSHAAIIGTDQWHLSGERYHSPPTSWKCGGPPDGVYANIMDAVLMLPPLCLFTGSSMTFWHRVNAEVGTISPYWALDGGVVELSQNGGATWQIINPTTPYPSRASPYNSIFLAPYQRCYSGTIDWKMETFDLSAYRGPVLIRFHFASDEQYGYEGWYIDDIHVSTEVPTDVPGGAAPRLWASSLDPAYPNPFNPVTVIPFELAERGPVVISIFDAAGRRVRTLVDEVRNAGRHTVAWNGTGERGTALASGVYFCRLSAGLYTATERLVLIR